MKIGIFGGTFNPPHNGHLRLIETFADKLELDKVLVIPDKRPVHKICEDLALDSDRAELCRRTFTGKNYEVSTMEIDRDTDSYMIFTVNEILSKYKDAQLFLIIGSDMFLSFHKWYKYREIMKKVYPVRYVARGRRHRKGTALICFFDLAHIYAVE